MSGTRTTLTPVPSLAEIAADPSKIEALDSVRAAALGAAFSGLAMSCALRAALLGAAPMMVVQPSGTLSPKEAADMLGISVSTLIQESLPGRRYAGLRVDNGARRVRFSAERLASFLSVRTSAPAAIGTRIMSRSRQPAARPSQKPRLPQAPRRPRRQLLTHLDRDGLPLGPGMTALNEETAHGPSNLGRGE